MLFIKSLTNFTALLSIVEQLFYGHHIILLLYNNKTIDIVDELLLKSLPNGNQKYITYNTDHQNIQSLSKALENLTDFLMVTYCDNDSDFNKDILLNNKVYFVHLIIIHQKDLHQPIASKFIDTLKDEMDDYNPILILWNERQAMKAFSMCTRNELRQIAIDSITNLCDRSANFMGSILTASGYFHAPRMMFMRGYTYNSEIVGIGGTDGYFLTLLAEYFNATIKIRTLFGRAGLTIRNNVHSPKMFYTSHVYRATWVTYIASNNM